MTKQRPLHIRRIVRVMTTAGGENGVNKVGTIENLL
jgi:hypothetical protein